MICRYKKQIEPPPTFWKDFSNLYDIIDTANYNPDSHPWFQENRGDPLTLKKLLSYQTKNNKKLGLLKDEAPINPYSKSSCFILSSTSLRLKMYNIEFNLHEIPLKNVCKGIPRKIAEKYSKNDYRNAVISGGLATQERFYKTT